MRLALHPGEVAVVRRAAGDPPPSWFDHREPFAALVRTEDELSLVCDAARVPAGERAERGWRRLVVDGPMAFSLTGVLAGLTVPLAEAGVPVFAISTFDTDHLLVPAARLDAAVAALRAAGHEVDG